MSYATILKAAAFAELKHRGQTRKDDARTPYIVHPLNVARIIASAGEDVSAEVIMAALLHDTIEDTDATEAELVEQFGREVTDMVLEVTDDKSLKKQERKAAQIRKAATLSDGAGLVKLGDKISNVTDVVCNPPVGWDLQRRLEYVEWAVSVAKNVAPGRRHFMQSLNQLREKFKAVGNVAIRALSTDSSNEKYIGPLLAHWVYDSIQSYGEGSENARPEDCILWEHPELLLDAGQYLLFEEVEEYRVQNDSHLSRRLLKCRECGQLYFYEFYEEIDWDDGDDSQWQTYVPVKTEEEIEILKATGQTSLMKHSPRLQLDWPKGQKIKKVFWIR